MRIRNLVGRKEEVKAGTQGGKEHSSVWLFLLSSHAWSHNSPVRLPLLPTLFAAITTHQSNTARGCLCCTP